MNLINKINTKLYLSIKQLSIITDISVSTLNSYSQNRRNISKKNIQKIMLGLKQYREMIMDFIMDETISK